MNGKDKVTKEQMSKMDVAAGVVRIVVKKGRTADDIPVQLYSDDRSLESATTPP